MSLFSFGKQRHRFGIIIDVGSGSVLTAIVHSNRTAKHPVIVWAHREHIALKEIDSVEKSAHAVLTALMNASLKLDAEGRKALATYHPGAKLTEIQTSIAAPWSYTVTKSINVEQDTEIKITEHLIDELVSAAQRQVEEELKQHSDSINLGLTVITKSTMDLLSNGYRVKHPEGEDASTLQLTQATVVAQQYVIDSLTEIHQKLFPSAKLESMSFILMFYCVIRSLYPHTDDVCLVDITDEASEIGIVRDGSLKY
jgi:cell division ATPase FtsA